MKPALAALWISSLAADAWTLRDGRSFDGDLAAADGLRATFTRPGKNPVVVPLADLSAGDAQTIREWRRDRRRPLVLPGRLAPWPARASAPAGDARMTGGDGGTFVYQSANFHITSDLKLPPAAANDIALALEATRAALIAIPLGLHGGGERRPYQVELLRDEARYARAGGLAGSGGHYDPRRGRMLVLLPNLGIEERDGALRLAYQNNLFILRHEVVHQLMDGWHGRLPMWLNEGIAEFIASLPYSRGHCTLQPPGAGMRDYLLKWRTSRNDRSIHLIPPATLMPMTRRDWDAAVRDRSAYDLYHSAALLTWHFIQLDHGARLAAFLEALRRGESPEKAEKTHLLRGGTREALHADVTALARKLGLEPAGFP